MRRQLDKRRIDKSQAAAIARGERSGVGGVEWADGPDLRIWETLDTFPG